MVIEGAVHLPKHEVHTVSYLLKVLTAGRLTVEHIALPRLATPYHGLASTSCGLARRVDRQIPSHPIIPIPSFDGLPVCRYAAAFLVPRDPLAPYKTLASRLPVTYVNTDF